MNRTFLYVKASPGLKVPYETKSNKYITEEAIEVPNTLYYRRRINDGDLIEVSDVEKKTSVKDKTEKGDQ